MKTKTTFLLLFLTSCIFCQIDLFKITNTSFNIKLEMIGKPSIYNDFNINGYAPLLLRKPSHFKKELVKYPKKIKKYSDTAIAEISSTSSVYKNIIEKFYLLVFDYKTNHPTVFISTEGSLDFSANKIIIDKNIKKNTLELATKKGKNEFIIDYTQKLSTNLGFSELLDSMNLIDIKYSIPIWDNSVKYGVHMFGTDSICFALYDDNHNGLFNDKNIDRLIISDNKHIPFFEIFETSSSVLISDSITIKIENRFFNVIFISPQGSLIYLDENLKTHTTNYVSLFDKIPETLYLNTDSNLVKTSEARISGNYFFTYVWIPRCIDCLKDLVQIDSLASVYKNKLNVLILLNKSSFPELKETARHLKLKSPQGLSNIKLNKELHVNGYPYSIMFGKDGKFLKKIKNIQELIIFLKTNE